MQFLIYIIMILNEIVKSAHRMGHHLIVDNIQLTQNLTCVMRVQRTCNSTVKFSKYVIIFILLSKVVVLSYNQVL